MPDITEPSAATQLEDEKASRSTASPGRSSTDKEDEFAEGGMLDAETMVSVAEHHKAMDKLGAEVKGEGQIP